MRSKYWRMFHQNAIVDPLTMLELYRSLIARSGPLTRVLSGLQNFVGRRKTGLHPYIHTYIHINVHNDTCINTHTYIRNKDFLFFFCFFRLFVSAQHDDAAVSDIPRCAVSQLYHSRHRHGTLSLGQVSPYESLFFLSILIHTYIHAYIHTYISDSYMHICLCIHIQYIQDTYI